MFWIALTLLSALFLGVYDLAKKSAVRENAVPVVLLANVATAATIYLPVVLLSWLCPDILTDTGFRLPPLSFQEHFLLFCKALLVGTSWTLAFFALKHLPLSIAAPIRSTSPIWTVLVAVGLLGEAPGWLQLLGVAIVLVAFLSFSRIGRAEGITFESNAWVGAMLVATLLGALSSLYDKHLLQNLGFEVTTVQAWFSIYLVPVMCPLALRWYFLERKSTPFDFRWSIPAIAVFLLLADYCYFKAVGQEEAMIALISPIRRTSVVIPFAYGIIWLSERNWRAKGLCIALMLVGVALIGLG